MSARRSSSLSSLVRDLYSFLCLGPVAPSFNHSTTFYSLGAGYMSLILGVELAAKAADEIDDAQSLVDLEDFQVSRHTQTDLTSFLRKTDDEGHSRSVGLLLHPVYPFHYPLVRS